MTDFRPALLDPPALRIASIRPARPPPSGIGAGAIFRGADASGMSSKGGGATGATGGTGGSSNLGIVVSSAKKKVICHAIEINLIYGAGL